MHNEKTNNRIKSFDGVVRKKTNVIFVQPKKSFKESLAFSFLKTAGVLLLVLSLSFGLAKTGGTISYFNDIESSIGNFMKAGTLGFSLSADEDTDQVVSLSLEEENVGSEQFNVTVSQDPDSLPMSYTVEGKLDEGTPAECQQVNLVADMGDYHYDNYEFTFLSPKMTDLGEWQFMVSIPVSSTIPVDAVCSGSIVFKAGLAGVSDDLANTYTDVKIYTFKLKNWGSAESLVEAKSLVAPEEVVEDPELVEEEATSTHETLEGDAPPADLVDDTEAPEALTDTPLADEIAPPTEVGEAPPVDENLPPADVSPPSDSVPSDTSSTETPAV